MWAARGPLIMSHCLQRKKERQASFSLSTTQHAWQATRIYYYYVKYIILGAVQGEPLSCIAFTFVYNTAKEGAIGNVELRKCK